MASLWMPVVITNLFPQKSTMLLLCKIYSMSNRTLKKNCLIDNKPIPLHVSPLMVRNKQDSLKKDHNGFKLAQGGLQLMLQCKKDVYLDTQYVLNYPSINLITNSLVKLGPAALIYKIDISCAFRQFFRGVATLYGLQCNSMIFLICLII